MILTPVARGLVGSPFWHDLVPSRREKEALRYPGCLWRIVRARTRGGRGRLVLVNPPLVGAEGRDRRRMDFIR